MSVMRVVILYPCTKFEVGWFSPFGSYGTFSVSASIGLETLTFDLWTSKWGHGSPVSSASFLLIFSVLCPSILDSGSGVGQTDRQTTAINTLCPTLWDVA